MKTSKSALRALVKRRSRALDPQDMIQKSLLISNKLLSTTLFQTAKKIGLFMSMPFEPSTEYMIERCFADGKTVYLPKCVVGKSTVQKNRLVFHEVSSMQQVRNLVERGKFKIREPTSGTNLMDVGSLDLLVVPGVAFTSNGDRLGHGAGFYDNFLSEYRTRFAELPTTAGICFSEQLVDFIPMEPHDFRMDMILSS